MDELQQGRVRDQTFFVVVTQLVKVGGSFEEPPRLLRNSLRSLAKLFPDALAQVVDLCRLQRVLVAGAMNGTVATCAYIAFTSKCGFSVWPR